MCGGEGRENKRESVCVLKKEYQCVREYVCVCVRACVCVLYICICMCSLHAGTVRVDPSSPPKSLDETLDSF